MVGEAGGELIGAIHRHQARLEDVADVQPVHLPALGDVEVVAGDRVADANLAAGGAGEEPARAPVLVQAETRLGAADQDFLVLGGQVRALLAQELLDRRRSVGSPAVEQEPVEEGLHALLVAAVIGVDLASGLQEVFLLGPHQLVDLAAEVLQEHVDLGLDHEPPSIICTNRRKR